MESNQNQVCFISVYFPAPDDARALEVKAAIQKLLDSPDARVEFRLMDGKVQGPPGRG